MPALKKFSFVADLNAEPQVTVKKKICSDFPPPHTTKVN